MNSKQSILFIVILFLGLTSFSGCASMKKLTSENEALRAENERLMEIEMDYEKSKNEILRLQEIEQDYEDKIRETEELSKEKRALHEEMDEMRERLNANLQEQIKRNEALVSKVKDHTIIEIGEVALFSSGEAKLSERGTEVINQMAEVLNEYPDYYIRVEGHTDSASIGEKVKSQFSSNWELSTARAINVIKHMTKNLHIDPSRFSAAGYSKHRPVSNNDTKEGRSKNRRVRIVVFKHI